MNLALRDKRGSWKRQVNVTGTSRDKKFARHENKLICFEKKGSQSKTRTMTAYGGVSKDFIMLNPTKTNGELRDI